MNEFSDNGPNSDQSQALTVSQLNRQSKMALESQFSSLWVEGEISNFKAYHSGHWYFTLKDDQAQIACTMFSARNRLVKGTPSNGQQVLVRGRISLYEARGSYQLQCENLQASGDGLLQQAFEQLKHKLQQQGYFEQSRKQALPPYPKHIGIVTAGNGAAVRDILSVLERRFASIKVTVFPVTVQGDSAPEQICQAISIANQVRFRTPLDLLIVGRGGGSLEDLQAFNHEAVAMAIVNSQLPIVSAVGHEVDVSISDWVADVRAPTPSAAAELVSPNGDELTQQFRAYEQHFVRLWQQQQAQRKLKLKHLEQRLVSPQQFLASQYQRLDDTTQRLERALQVRLAQQQQRLKHIEQRLSQQSPALLLSQQQQRLKQQQTSLQKAMHNRLEQAKNQLAQQLQLLHNLSPLQTLARGYSITRLENGQIIEQAQQVQPGSEITTLLKQGEIKSQVLEVIKADSSQS